MIRKLIVACIALACLGPLAPTISAGGWAAIAFDTPPGEVTIGEETTLTFRVLAHNNPATPVSGMETTFLFDNKGTGYFVAATGEATDDPEVYAITFTLDHPGEWDLRAMIHNYLPDGPILWTAPHSTMAVEPQSAGM